MLGAGLCWLEDEDWPVPVLFGMCLWRDPTQQQALFKWVLDFIMDKIRLQCGCAPTSFSMGTRVSVMPWREAGFTFEFAVQPSQKLEVMRF